MQSDIDAGGIKTDMRVVVFGATGLCGEEIADVFETRHEVIRFKGHRDGDISNLFEIQKKLEPMKPDLIINATGLPPSR